MAINNHYHLDIKAGSSILESKITESVIKTLHF